MFKRSKDRKAYYLKGSRSKDLIDPAGGPDKRDGDGKRNRNEELGIELGT